MRTSMVHIKKWSVLLIGAATTFTATADPYVGSVVAYTSGALPAGVASYTNTASILGEPSRVTPGDWGGPVDPFSAPYLASQLLSVGQGGSLTVQLSAPVHNLASHPYGVDFLIFGSAGFMITNGDYTGGGITDGTIFGNNDGATRVSVSYDNQTYYALTPSLTPVVDSMYPTDGSGDFTIPVNPNLTASDFAGKGLAGIRDLYAGSAGGTGYDLDWAVDAEGHRMALDGIQYIRIDVLDGHAEIDGIAGVAAIPEPASVALLAMGLGTLWLSRRTFR